MGEYGRVGGRTQVGELTVVDGAKREWALRVIRITYILMTLLKNKFNKRYFRKEKKNPKPKHTNKSSRTRQQQ